MMAMYGIMMAIISSKCLNRDRREDQSREVVGENGHDNQGKGDKQWVKKAMAMKRGHRMLSVLERISWQCLGREIIFEGGMLPNWVWRELMPFHLASELR